MEFDTSKNKLQKIENTQNDIDNSLFHKANPGKNLIAPDTVLQTPKILFDSDYQVYSTVRAFGGLISIPINMPIVAQHVSFSDTINITEDMIPHVRFNISIKKPILNNISGLYIANISTYDNILDTQVGIFKENTPIRNQEGAVIGNTGSGSGTAPEGDALVTVTSHGLFTADGQRSTYSEDRTSSLTWFKILDNLYTFSIDTRVMIIVDTEELENVGVTNQEGNRVYVAHYDGEPLEIVYYTLTDNRVSVSYPAYRPITSDIEAKLILSIPPKNIWENYSHYRT